MEQKQPCKKCSAAKSMLKNNWPFLALSVLMLFAAIYGIIHIVKDILSTFGI